MTLLRTLLLLAMVVALPAGVAHAQSSWIAHMTGGNEVPANASPATGTFEGTLNAAQTSMSFTLTYSGLVGTMTQAHLHRAPAGVNGSIIYWLALGSVPSPIVGCTGAAAPPSGTASPCPGTFNPADVADLQNGNIYANLHSTTYPGGEIRGQLVTGVPVNNSTWGKMKAMFR